jgi:hypothetical protein
MKNVLVFVLLISILLVIGILYYDSYTCSKHVVETLVLSDQKIQEINTKYKFSVTEGELPLFKQLLVDNNYMKLYEIYRDTGFVFKGSYRDTGVRAIPNYLGGGFRTPIDCVNKAKNNKYTIAGVQFYGQCFGGTDLSMALNYGVDTRKHAGYPLGVDWNNQVYAREIVEDEDVSNLDIQGYENVIKWLTTPEVNINSYTEFKNLMEFIKKEQFDTIDGTTIVEGAMTQAQLIAQAQAQTQAIQAQAQTQAIQAQAQTQSRILSQAQLQPILPLNPPPSTSVTGVDVIADAYKKLKDKWESKLTEPPGTPNRYVFEFTQNRPPVYPDLVANAINEFSKLDKVGFDFVRKMFKSNNIRSSLQIQLLTDKLKQIGYTNTSTANLYEILEKLNKYGRKGNDTEIDNAFIQRYKNFGLNTESDLHTFMTKLIDLNVRDPPSSPNPPPLSFATFATLVAPLGVKYGERFDWFYNIMIKIYIPPSNKDLEQFFNRIQRNYFKKNTSITLKELATFKDDLKNYKITYTEYMMIHNDYLSKVTVNGSNKESITKFVTSYNEEFIRGTTKLPISTEANSKGTISLYVGMKDFFDTAISRGFVFPSNPNTFNFDTLISECLELNISGNTLKTKNRVIQPFSTFEGFSSEPVEVIPEKTVEGLTGYYDSLIQLGFTEADKMPIILPENESIGAQTQNQSQLDSRLKQYIGTQNDYDRAMVLSYMASIQTPGSQLYRVLLLFKGIGVNMTNFDTITNALYTLRLTSFEYISPFLQKLNQLNINLNGLKTFTDTLAEFGATYRESPSSFFRFLDTLIYYNITNTTSTYDIQNTKFYNFMYNMKLDKIKFNHYDQFYEGLFTGLTNSMSLRESIPSENEKKTLEIQLRDIIIRKDSLLFGIDNTLNGKNSNEINNSTFQLDPAINIRTLYTNITSRGTIMPLVPIQQHENTITNSVEIYGYMLTFRTDIINSNLRLVSQILTPYEYEMMKTDPSKLHARSVMSRLCSLLKQNMDSGMYASNLSDALLLNSVRTFPYKTFELLSASFRSSGNMYDKDNSISNEGNNYTLPPPVKEVVRMPFSTLTPENETSNDYQSVFSSNTAFPFVKISDTKIYDSYDLSKTSFMKHSNVM